MYSTKKKIVNEFQIPDKTLSTILRKCEAILQMKKHLFSLKKTSKECGLDF